MLQVNDLCCYPQLDYLLVPRFRLYPGRSIPVIPLTKKILSRTRYLEQGFVNKPLKYGIEDGDLASPVELLASVAFT